MPDVNVSFEMDKEKVKLIVATTLKAMRFFAAITPTKVDDQTIDVLENLVAQPWFADVIAMLFSLDSGKAPK